MGGHNAQKWEFPHVVCHFILLICVLFSECLDYFQSLPFSCRFPGGFDIKKDWIEERKCHNHTFNTVPVLSAIGGRDAETWEFPHVVCFLYNCAPIISFLIYILGIDS